jgi:hypothetical protein
MPKGPKGQKRKADVIGNAVLVMRIATGQEDESPEKSAAKARGGMKGGPARSSSLTPEKRKAIAEKAAKSRWKK